MKHFCRSILAPTSIGEFLAIKKANWKFQKRAICRYYPKSWRFAISDILLGFLSFSFNPYRMCRKRGDVYGETPCESLHRIATFCSLSASDCWLELGSGRGKGAFWVSHFIGCRTIGIEKVRLFSWIGKAIAALLRVKNLSFLCDDMANSPFSKASVVYLYSTCMDDAALRSLTEKMKALPAHAKVITISAPLPASQLFRVSGSFPISFLWGDTEAYVNERLE